MKGIQEHTLNLLRDKLMKDKRKLEQATSTSPPSSSSNIERKSVKRCVSPIPQRCKRRIIEDSVEQVLRDTIFQLSVNKLQFSRWKAHEPPLSRTVLIWNMVRVIDKEMQEEKVVDDVFSLLGPDHADHNVKFIKVCRAHSPYPAQVEEEEESAAQVEKEVDEDEEMTEPVILVTEFVGTNHGTSPMNWSSAAAPAITA